LTLALAGCSLAAMGQAPGGGHEGERFSKADARRLLGPQPELALGAGKALLASTPRDPELRLLIGSAHRRLGDVASACAVLRPLAVEQPKAWGVHFELGASLACGGDTADALISLLHSCTMRSPINAAMSEALLRRLPARLCVTSSAGWSMGGRTVRPA
jgi:predicted Zn-dependent protease